MNNEPQNIENQYKPAELPEQENWKKNLIVICISLFISMIGLSGCMPFLPLFVRTLGVTEPDKAEFWSGMVFAGPYLLSIITVPFWGVLGDKYGRKSMIIRAVFGLAITMSLMSFSQNVTQLFLLRILQGAVSGFIAAALAFISVITPHNKTGFAMGLFHSSLAAGSVVGPLLGGILADVIGIRLVFIIIGILFVISGSLVAIMVTDKKDYIEKSKEDTVFKNLKYITSRKDLGILLLLVVLTQAGMFFTFPIFAFFVESLHAPEQYLSTITGILMGVLGICMFITAPFWGKIADKKDYRNILRFSSFMAGIAMLAHIFAPTYIILFPIRIVAGIFIAALSPTIFSTLSKKTPENRKSGVMGLASSANLLGSLISFSLCGIVSFYLGMNWTFIISGILFFLAAGIIV